MKEKPAERTDSIEEAKTLIERNKSAKIENCRKEIQQVLEKYGCLIDCSILLRANAVIPQISISLKPDDIK